MTFLVRREFEERMMGLSRDGFVRTLTSSSSGKLRTIPNIFAPPSFDSQAFLGSELLVPVLSTSFFTSLSTFLTGTLSVSRSRLWRTDFLTDDFSLDPESCKRRFSRISEQDFSNQRAKVLNSMNTSGWVDDATNILSGSTASAASRRLHTNLVPTSSGEFSMVGVRKTRVARATNKFIGRPRLPLSSFLLCEANSAWIRPYCKATEGPAGCNCCLGVPLLQGESIFMACFFQSKDNGIWVSLPSSRLSFFLFKLPLESLLEILSDAVDELCMPSISRSRPLPRRWIFAPFFRRLDPSLPSSLFGFSLLTLNRLLDPLL
mmetsp:Transcript_27958/g.47227  ORF Transcript_27958/g.47227 Transcript_27958/m.47227 type:complete len:319 (-) Transcript_27958:729-1685(-)